MKSVSIIVPIYNVEDEVADFLKSFHGYKEDIVDEVEMVFVNDGSTDSSSDKIERFVVNNPEIDIKFIQQSNKGLSMARNVGMEAAEGKYIWFLDPDDIVVIPHFLQILKLIKNNDLDFIQFGFDKFTNLSELKNFKISPSVCVEEVTPSEMFRKLAYGEIENYAWAHILKASIYSENALQFPAGKNFEDVATTFKVINHSVKMAITDVPVVHYRQRDTSIVHTPSLKNFDDFLAAVDEFKNYDNSFSEKLNEVFFYKRLMILYRLTFEMANSVEVIQRRENIRDTLLNQQLLFLGISRFLLKGLIKTKLYMPLRMLFWKIRGVG